MVISRIKKEILLLFLIMGISSALPLSAFSQDYYEKWSNIRNRYEYYDSNGNMMGYKKYSNVNRRWEYHNVNSEPIRKPITYNPYTSTTDTDLVNKVLETKQSRYDYNVQRIQNKIDELHRLLGNLELQKEFNREVSEFNSKYKNIDYSNNSNTSQVLNYFINTYNNLINKNSSFDNKNKKNHSFQKKYPPKDYITTAYLKADIAANLKLKPNFDSQTICVIKPSYPVLLIKHKYNKSYDYVYSNGYYGYVLSDLLNKTSSVEETEKIVNSNKTESTNFSKSRYSINTYVSTHSYAPIVDSPSSSGKKVGEVKNNKVYILSEPKEGYYKIKTGDIVGYISSSWLKEKIEMTNNQEPKDKKNNYISSIPKKILGFYVVEKIEEYTLNSITGEKKIIDIISNESKLKLTEKAIFFQRYKEPEKTSIIRYLGFDSESNKYKFEDNYNQHIYLDKELTTISWIEKSNSTLKKVFTYYGLKKIFPQ